MSILLFIFKKDIKKKNQSLLVVHAYASCVSVLYAYLVKLVNTTDSKSVPCMVVGSSPTVSTFLSL